MHNAQNTCNLLGRKMTKQIVGSDRSWVAAHGWMSGWLENNGWLAGCLGKTTAGWLDDCKKTAAQNVRSNKSWPYGWCLWEEKMLRHKDALAHDKEMAMLRTEMEKTKM